MSLKFHWFLPTSGDGRAIMGRGHSLPLVGQLSGSGNGNGNGAQTHIRGAAAQARPPDIEYLAQIARSAEQLGFEGVLTPTGTWCEDAWLTTAALTRDTTRLKFLVAFRPGLISPTLAAQMAATYQRMSGGRLLLNVVTGGQADEQRRFGDHLSHDERYARTGEFLAIVRGAWSGQPFDFAGEHYQVTGATVLRPPDPGTRCLLRRLLAGGGAGRGEIRGHVPDLGRAASSGRGEDRLDPGAGRGPGADNAVRHPAARDHPRHRGRRLDGSQPPARLPRPG